MKFTIEEFTLPLDATILARKDFTFASGAGGIGGAIVIAPHNPIVSGEIVASGSAGGGDTILGAGTITLIGGRKLTVAVTLDGFQYPTGAPPVPVYNATAKLRVNGIFEPLTYPIAQEIKHPFTMQWPGLLSVAGACLLELVISNAGSAPTMPISLVASAVEFDSI